MCRPLSNVGLKTNESGLKSHKLIIHIELHQSPSILICALQSELSWIERKASNKHQWKWLRLILKS